MRSNHRHVGADLESLSLQGLQLPVEFIALLLHVLPLLLQGGLHPAHLVLGLGDLPVLLVPVALPVPPLLTELLLQVSQLLQLLVVFVPPPAQSRPLLALGQLHLDALQAGEVFGDHAHDVVQVVGHRHRNPLLRPVQAQQRRESADRGRG